MTGSEAAISIMSEELTWASLYYFTYELKLIQCVLETEYTKVSAEKRRRIKKIMYILILISIISGIIYSIYAWNEVERETEFFSSDYYIFIFVLDF